MTRTASPARALAPIWALAALVISLASGALCVWLGLAQIALTHGTGAGSTIPAHSPAAAALTSPLATVSGVPVVIWALPGLVLVLMLTRSAGTSGSRAAAARGGLVAVTLLLAAMATVLVLVTNGLSCWPLLGWAALQIGLVAVAVVPPGPRKPAWPEVEDWLSGMLVGMTVLMGVGVGARLDAYHLDQDVAAAMAPPTLDLPRAAAVATALQPVGPVAVPPPRSPVPIDDLDPSVGPLTAPVTAVAFLDLQDPASRHLAWIISELEPRFSDRVRFINKHLPMDATCNEKRRRTIHTRSCAVAIALQCAHQQGAFVGYRHALLRAPDAVEDEDLTRWAASLDLDLSAFAKCRDSSEAADAVREDVDQASKGGVIDPPWLFIEGRVIDSSVLARPDGEAVIVATLEVALGDTELSEDGTAMAKLSVPVQSRDPLGPAAMVELPGGYIDAVEASVDSQGRAVAVIGVPPQPVSLKQARAACTSSGRQLCSQAAWVAACEGAPADSWAGRLQPYADPWRAGWCADTALDLAGGHPACRTPEGVLDLAGNLAEWVDEGLLLGGAAGDGSAVGCRAQLQPPGPGWRNDKTGFRCCLPLASAGASAAAPPAVDLIAPVALPADQLPAALRELAGPGPAVVVPWRIDCAGCQRALSLAASVSASQSASQSASVRQAQAKEGTDSDNSVIPVVVALSNQPSRDEAAQWLAASRLDVVAVDDRDADFAGQLGVSTLPWMALYGADDHLIEVWTQLPTDEALSASLRAH